MARLDGKVKKILIMNNIKTIRDARYMDDIGNMLKALGCGWRWNGECLDWRPEWAQQDASLSRTERTIRALLGIMNSIYKGLVCTMELGEEFENTRLPTLDMELWVEDGKLLYSFFENPTARMDMINFELALPENCKMSSLAQNLIRRNFWMERK